MTPSRALPLGADRRARLDATDLARVAVLAAVVAVLGLPGSISVLGGVPITAQTLGVMLAGAVLGARLGALALAVLLALVAVGLPLLSGGTGGLGVSSDPPPATSRAGSSGPQRSGASSTSAAGGPPRCAPPWPCWSAGSPSSTRSGSPCRAS